MEDNQAHNPEIGKDATTQSQLDFLKQASESNLPVYLVGGYADEALLSSSVTREHHDIDFISKRDDMEQIQTHLRDTGFEVTGVTEKGSDKPYKLLAKRGATAIDIAFFDPNASDDSVSLEVAGAQDQKYRVSFPKSGLVYPDQSIQGISVRTVSPLMMLQIRRAARVISRFTEVRDKDTEAEKALHEKYFPNESLDSEKFSPRIEELSL